MFTENLANSSSIVGSFDEEKNNTSQSARSVFAENETNLMHFELQKPM